MRDIEFQGDDVQHTTGFTEMTLVRDVLFQKPVFAEVDIMPDLKTLGFPI